MRVVVLAIGLVLGACLAEPGRPVPGDGSSDSGGSCEAQTVVDNFEIGEACKPWGHSIGNVTIDLQDGALQLGTVVNNTGDGGCVSDTDMMLGTAGLFAEVRHALSAPDGYTLLVAEATGGPQIGVVNNSFVLSERFGLARVFASLPYDPIAMRWWRLRASGSGETIGEYSADGRAWTMLGASGFVLQKVRFAIFAGTMGPVTTPEIAEFESVNLCP